MRDALKEVAITVVAIFGVIVAIGGGVAIALKLIDLAIR